MADLDAFLPYVRGAFPMVPDELMRQAVRDAAIEFCERTRVVQQRVPVTVAAGASAHPVRITGGSAFEVLNVWREDRELRSDTVADLLERGPATGQPIRYALNGEGQLILWPVPASDETLEANAVFAPVLDEDEVPDVLLAEWREAIAGGAKKRLGRDYAPFHNTEQVSVGMAEFEWAVQRATVQRARGRTGRVIASRSRFF